MSEETTPVQTEDKTVGLTPKEQRILEKAERMRLRREARAKRGEDGNHVSEEENEGDDVASATRDDNVVNLHTEPTTTSSPQSEHRHVVAEPVALPPVYAVEDEDSEAEEDLDEVEREKKAKLKRMEERRHKKRAEEEMVGGYVEVPSASSLEETKQEKPQETEKPQESEKAEEQAKPELDEHAPAFNVVRINSITSDTHSVTPRTASSTITTAPETTSELPPVKIFLPPESARPLPASTTMNAVVREGLLGTTITFKTGVPVSLVAPLERRLIVRVLAAAINPVDYKIPRLIGGYVVGLDFCGEVVSVRKDTTPFAVGDIVYGNATGCLANYVTCDPDKISLKPKLLTPIEAAALPTAYLTAYQGLAKYIKGSGVNVLVIGASGGCGIAALQVARRLGAAEIVAVCSAKNAELVKQHGATRVIDYNTEKVSTAYQKWGENFPQQFYDVVFDAATGSGGKEDYFDEAQKVLKPTGKLVCLNGGVGTWLRKFTNSQKANQELILTKHSAEDLAALTQMIDSNEEKGGGFRPVIGQVFAFNEQNVKAAFDLLKSRRTTGKIVLQMSEEQSNNSNTTTSASQTSETKQETPAPSS